jgi:hypothetical protein
MALQIVRNKQVRITKGTFSLKRVLPKSSSCWMPFFFPSFSHTTHKGTKRSFSVIFDQQKRLLSFYFTKLLKEAISKLLREAAPSF